MPELLWSQPKVVICLTLALLGLIVGALYRLLE